LLVLRIEAATTDCVNERKFGARVCIAEAALGVAVEIGESFETWSFCFDQLDQSIL
jgi:hypothetical protein